MSSMNGSNYTATSSFISLKTLKLMEDITSIIKDTDTLKLNKELNRLLYRATDALMELKLELLQLKVSNNSSSTQ